MLHLVCSEPDLVCVSVCVYDGLYGLWRETVHASALPACFGSGGSAAPARGEKFA